MDSDPLFLIINPDPLLLIINPDPFPDPVTDLYFSPKI
jgi:hypothetical protein